MSAKDCELSNEKSEEEESDEEYCIKTRRGVIIRSPKDKPDRLNGEYSYNSKIQQRVIGQPCSDCKMECDLRIAERFRLDNYLHFWGKIKTWDERRTHIRRLVQVLRVPHPKNVTRKKFLRKYYLEMYHGVTLVCKTMFFNTFAISEKFLETTIQKYPDNIVNESELQLVNNPISLPKNFNSPTSKPTPSNSTVNPPDNEEASKINTPSAEDEPLHPDNKSPIKAPCLCPKKCAEKLSDEIRFRINKHFWELKSPEERKLFIINTIERDRYTSILSFVVPTRNEGNITVCQEMYLNTLGLKEDSIKFLLPNKPVSEGPDKTAETGSEPKNFQNEPTEVSGSPGKSKSETRDYVLPVKRIKLETTPLKPPCSCNLECKLKLTEHIRRQIHGEFWKLPTQVDQKHFILSTIQVQNLENDPSKEKCVEIQTFTLPLHYENIVVCKEMYLQTLSVSESFVNNAVKNINNDGSLADDDEEDSLIYNPKKPDQEDKEDSRAPVKRIRKSKVSKTIGPPCPPSCRHRCSEQIDQEQRVHLHERFWSSMSWLERKQFVMDTVQEFPIKNRSVPGRLTKRNFTRIYTLPDKEKKITVCQKMYFNTLSVCSKFVSTVHIWASQVKW